MSEITATLTQILTDASEASDLSGVLSPPNQGESLLDLNTRLLTTRSRQVTVGELLGRLIRMRAVVASNLIEKRGILLDAEASIVSQKKKVLTEDFSSAQERNASMASKTIEERIAVRNAEKMNEELKSAMEYVREKHRELGYQVADVNTRLKIITLEPNWD